MGPTVHANMHGSHIEIFRIRFNLIAQTGAWASDSDISIARAYALRNNVDLTLERPRRLLLMKSDGPLEIEGHAFIQSSLVNSITCRHSWYFGGLGVSICAQFLHLAPHRILNSTTGITFVVISPINAPPSRPKRPLFTPGSRPNSFNGRHQKGIQNQRFAFAIIIADAEPYNGILTRSKQAGERRRRKSLRISKRRMKY